MLIFLSLSFADTGIKSFKNTSEIYGIWYLEKNPSYCFDVSSKGIQLYSRDNMKTTISKTKFIPSKNIKLSKDKMKILCEITEEKYNIEFSRDKNGNILLYDKNNFNSIIKKTISLTSYKKYIETDKTVKTLIQKEINIENQKKYTQKILNEEARKILSENDVLRGFYVGDELAVDFLDDRTLELTYDEAKKNLINGSVKVVYDNYTLRQGNEIEYIYSGYDEDKNYVILTFYLKDKENLRLVDVDIVGVYDYNLGNLKNLKNIQLILEN